MMVRVHGSMAGVAYKLATLRMESLDASRAAIACIALGVFDGLDRSQLLRAAQVAMSEPKRSAPATANQPARVPQVST